MALTLISIIIPTYKPETYLKECLLSIQKQTFCKQKFEVLIVLNGDKNPYFETIEIWMNSILSDMSVHLIYSQKCGVSNARNLGISEAKGKYLIFIDDDDVISENYIADLYKFAQPNTITVSNIALLKENKIDFNYPASITFKKLKKIGYNSMYDVRRVLNGPWMKLYPREIIGNIRFNSSLQLGEDALFNFTLSKNVKDIRFTDETAIYYYRIRPNSSWDTKSFRQLSKNMVLLLWLYNKIFFSNPLKYNFLYFISRIVAVIISFTPYLYRKVKQ